MNLNYFIKYSLWIVSILINSFGNFLLIKSNFGSGPWIAASMGVAKAFSAQVGFCTIVLNILVYIPIIFISKQLNIIRLIGSFLVAFIFGKFLDVFLINLSWIDGNNLVSRIILFILGDLILSAGISIYLRVNIALNPFDQFLQTVNEFLLPDIRKANLVYLGVPLLLGIVLGIYNNFYFDGIGLGTIIMFLFNGVFIKFFHKIIPISANILHPEINKNE